MTPVLQASQPSPRSGGELTGGLASAGQRACSRVRAGHDLDTLSPDPGHALSSDPGHMTKLVPNLFLRDEKAQTVTIVFGCSKKPVMVEKVGRPGARFGGR